MPVLRSYPSVRTVSLVACGFLIANVAVGQPSPTPPCQQTPTATGPTPTSPQPAYLPPPADRLDEIKRRLENEKLEAEIAKIKSDISNGDRQLVWPGSAGLARLRRQNLYRLGKGGDFRPDPVCLLPSSSVLGGSNVIAAEMEEVVDLVVG